MRVFPYLLLLTFFLQSCGLREREEIITRKEKELETMEAELLLKEQQLAEKEKALLAKELSFDSTRKITDTDNIYEPRIVGKWSVKMHCTETTCEGSAIGDTKAEQWEINYSDSSSVVVKAYADKVLTRIYNGYYNSNSGLHLSHENSIYVSLSFTEKGKMVGTREITQRDCRIVYALAAEKAL